MAAGLKNRGLLDPEQCWKDWNIHSGSLGAVRDKLLKEGVINEKTGNPPTKSGIEKSAFSWAIKNQDEARKDLEYAWRQKGFILTDEKWRNFLVDAARLVFYQRPKRFKNFIESNGLQDLI